MAVARRAGYSSAGFSSPSRGFLLLYLLAAIVTQYSDARIDRLVERLHLNTIPNLTEARSILRDIDTELDVATFSPEGRAAALGRIPLLRGDLNARFDAYERDASYPRQREAFEQMLQPARVQLDRGIHKVEAGAPTADLHALALDIDRETAAMDQALTELIRIDNAETQATRTQIIQTRRRTVRLPFLLELLSSIAAAGAAWLAVRTASRFQALQRQNIELEAARARELETFAQRVAHDLLSPLGAMAFGLSALERRHSDEQTRTTIDRSRRALTRTEQMVQGILAFARSGAKPNEAAHAPLQACVRAAVDEALATDPHDAPEIEVEPLPAVQLARA